MRHPSAYLDWYIHVPRLEHDFRSSGTAFFTHDVRLDNFDLSVNYDHGNPVTTKLVAKRYGVNVENVFISSEGASGQNARIIRYLAENKGRKNEAVVEYPTYEPLLRQVQEHFQHVKRLERKESEGYRLDSDALKSIISERTRMLVLTNPHAPSGAVSDAKALLEIMHLAREHGFYVVCDEIYAEFDRKKVPTLFSIDPEWGIVTTSFTKAYGLGGLKFGVALANRKLVEKLYTDVLNTVGNSPNIVQALAAELLSTRQRKLEKHKQKWTGLRKEAECWLKEKGLEYFPSDLGVTLWVKTPVKDTYKWTRDCTIPRFNLAAVPGTFFLYEDDYELKRTNMLRLSLGNISPKGQRLAKGLATLESAMKAR